MAYRFLPRLLSLRLWLPVLVLVYALVGGLALYVVERRVHGPEFEAEFETAKLIRTAQIQSEVERWLQLDEPGRVQSIFAELGAEPELQMALYLDATGRLLASTQQAWVGGRLDTASLGLAPADQGRLAALIESVRGGVQQGALLTANRNLLLVCRSVALPAKSNQPDRSRRGTLMIGYDLGPSKAASLEELRVEFGTYFASSLLIALAVGISLHYLVIRRLRRVAADIAKLAPEREPVHPGAGRGDEIAELAGQFAAMSGTVSSEIERREQIEKELRHSNRVLRTLSTCNQVLIHAATEPELLHEICRVIVEEGGYRMAWVGYAEQDERKSVRPAGHAGYEEGYLEQANISWGDNERGHGPTGTAIRTGQPTVCRNMLTDSRLAPWRDEAHKRGYASSLVLPLREGARTFGALTIYAPEPEAFDADEVKLLSELADDLVFGLTALRSKEALRRAGIYNRSLIEASLDPLVTIGPDGKITDVNAATEAATGRTRAELVGTDFCDYFSDPAQARAGYQQVFREGLVRDYPLELRHRDGKSISVLYNASVYRDEAGQVIGVFAAARDITERKRAEETLRRSEAEQRQLAGHLELERARLSEAQAVAQIGSWDLDLRTNILTWSDECFRIFDIDQRRFGASYEAFLERVHPDDRAMVDKAYTDSVANHTSYAIDHRLIRADGSVRYVHERCHTYYDDAGRALRSVGTAQDITERKEADKALRESEEKYRTLIDKLHAAVVVHAADTRIITCNPVAQTLLGLTEDQLLGKTSIDPSWHFIREDGTQMPLTEYPVNQVLATHQPLRNLVAGVHRPGNPEEVWVMVNANPVFGWGDKITEVIVTFIDITERKRAQEKIGHLAAIVESSDDAIIGKALDERIVSWNKGAERIYGYTAAEIVGRPVSLLVPPELRSELVSIMEGLKRGVLVEHLETTRVRKDGQVIHVALTISPIRDVRGRIVGASTIARDITERKQAEAALHRSQEEIRDLYEHAPCGYHSLGPDGTFIRINDTELSWLGYTRDEVVGKMKFTDLVTPQSLDTFQREFPLFKERGWANDLEFEVRRKDGSILPLSLSATAIRDAQGHYLMSRSVVHDITERRRAEREQKQTNELLGRVFDTTHFSVVYLDRDFNFLLVNRAYAQACGHPPEFFPGKNHFALYPHAKNKAVFRDVVRTGQPATVMAKPFSFPDHPEWGVTYWDWTLHPVKNSAGAVEALLFILLDVTERKRAEEKLRLAGAYNRSLIEASIDPLVTIGPDGKITDVNAATEQVTGCTRAELIGSDFSDYFTEPEKAREGYRRVFARGFVTDYPLTIRNRHVSVGETAGEHTLKPCPRCGRFHGALTDVLYNASLFRDADGKPLGVFAAARDITERKRAEEALLERERHSQSLLRLSRALERSQSYAEALTAARDEVRAILGYQSVWIYRLTPDKKQLKALLADGALESKVMSEEGTATLTIKGDRMLEEIVAAKDIVVVEDARTDPRTDKASVAKSGVITIVNIPIILFDRHFGIMGTGTTSAEGVRPPTPVEREYLLALASHMAVTLDRIYLLTERKQAEEEVRRLNAELERRVADRTHELTAANQGLAAANQELESFSYSVSHDLRAPLRSIDGFSRILLEEYTAKLDEEGKDSLRRLRGASQRMGELIDQILKLSRTTRGEMRHAPVDLSALAREVSAELQNTSPERQVEWVIAPNLTAVADPTLLRAVLQNLLDNAWKFTSRRPRARIEFGATATPEGGRAFFVRDDGVGFDPTYADKLFSPFQRMHTVAEFPGTGIGLATVQRIIHRHGGKVWAESKVDAGATFYFTLPIQPHRP